MVSRPTAYRYFLSRDELLIECTFHTGRPSLQDLFTHPDTPAGAEERAVRPGYRIGMIEKALAPSPTNSDRFC